MSIAGTATGRMRRSGAASSHLHVIRAGYVIPENPKEESVKKWWPPHGLRGSAPKRSVQRNLGSTR